MKLNFPIPPEVIRNIEYETREICANLTIMHSNLLVIDNSSVVYGENPQLRNDTNSKGFETNFRIDPSRASCSVKYYTPVIFHTHPRTSYATPSLEDIIKVLKHKMIKTSVIITAWGVFQIVKMKHVEIPDTTILEKIKNSIDYINRSTVNPQYLSTRGTESSIGLNKNLEWNQLSNIQQKIVIDQLHNINNTLSNTIKIFLNEPYIYLR